MKSPLLTNGFSHLVSFSNDDEADMFDLAPISLWVEDYSALKKLFDQWRRDGVANLRTYLQADPKRVICGMRAIRVLKVNRRTLSLFGASDLDELIENLDQILREDTLQGFIDEMVQFWNGHTSFSYKKVNYSLSGRRIDTRLN